ncbi:MAG: IS1634 family transposase, partial [Epsilonproteobacteria bacterium]
MDIKSKQVDVIPMINHYIEEMGLHEIFDRYIPNTHNANIKPAQVYCTMITNILVASKPLYKIEEFFIDYMDGRTEPPELATKYNDDRCARDTDRLYQADRSSMMLDAVASAIHVHNLEMNTIHNDSTSLTFSGAYNEQSEEAVQLEYGYNKDHRPDHKQIVFGLNITEDGHVPIGYEAYNGSTADSATHQPNWDVLRNFLGKEDFIYVADCKLSSQDNLNHIHNNGGTFITLLPKNIKEIKQFMVQVKEGKTIDWETDYCIPAKTKKDKDTLYQTYNNEVSVDGYRIIWIHSNHKETQDQTTRERRLTKAEEQLQELSDKLNQYYLKTHQQIEKAVKKITTGLSNQLYIEINEESSVENVQVGRGRAGENTQYKEVITITYSLEWSRNDEIIERESRVDGLFPLITNSKALSAVDVLKTYKQQPFLEIRFQTGKSILEVAPVFLKKNERIEAMVFLFFIALMIVSLIERNIRQQMKDKGIESLPILPTGLKTKSPTW